MASDLDVDNLRALKLLGKGATGTVFLAHDTLSDHSPFALKVVPKHHHHKSSSNITRARHEISVLSNLPPHPFLPTISSSFESEELIGWATPFCPGGDLNTLRYKQIDHVFSQSAIKFYLAEIVCALEKLHSMGIAYRDLKPENILVQSSGHITLTDFDLSKKLTPAGKPPDKSTLAGKLPDPKNEPGKLPETLTEYPGKLTNKLADKPRKLPEKSYNPGKLPNKLNYNPGKQPYQENMPGKLPDKLTHKPGKLPDQLTHKPGKLTDVEDKPGKVKPKKTHQLKFARIFGCESKISPENAPRRKISFSGGCRSDSFVGTVEYVSPEVVRGEPHSYGIDWWALGVLAYEMLYGTTPFKGKNRRETYRNVLTKRVELVGRRTALMDLIGRLLEKDPTKRLGYHRGAEEIKEHEFFEGVRWDLLTEISRPPFVPEEGEWTEKMTPFDVREYFVKGGAAPSIPSSSMNSSSDDDDDDLF